MKVHALSVYKKHLYKKQLVEFMKNKKQGLVRFQHAKKRLSHSKVVIYRKNEKNASNMGKKLMNLMLNSQKMHNTPCCYQKKYFFKTKIHEIGKIL